MILPFPLKGRLNVTAMQCECSSHPIKTQVEVVNGFCRRQFFEKKPKIISMNSLIFNHFYATFPHSVYLITPQCFYDVSPFRDKT